jgi:hypothetical protein
MQRMARGGRDSRVHARSRQRQDGMITRIERVDGVVRGPGWSG